MACALAPAASVVSATTVNASLMDLVFMIASPLFALPLSNVHARPKQTQVEDQNLLWRRGFTGWNRQQHATEMKAYVKYFDR